MDPILKKTGGVDIAAIGYPSVREVFNETLQLCVDKLSKKDLGLAQEILGDAAFDDDEPGIQEMLADTALYSRKGSSGGRRAIDRIAPKLPVKRDPLKSAIAARLPDAFFSVLEIGEVHPQGGVLARDLLDGGRVLHVMDNALAVQVTEQGGLLLAGRFVDLGPWHIGFGIVTRVRKSEAVAISLALSQSDDQESARDNLHELLYPAHLYGGNLVMAALEPMIMSLAMAIDTDMIEIDDLAAGLGSLLPGKPASRRRRKAVSS